MKPIYFLALLPFIGLLVGLPFANRVTPYVLGMPFLLFWNVLWVVLTSILLAIMYKFDPMRKESGNE
ncbi:MULTISPECIES: DUF3311 domain-containing protein [Peribacillus]|uniref:DUF3311 domain-containing protein n=1 Tax=Peribacillus butanolivorans TaxID=421767 RepID=A0AAX0RZG2_9BACI|nr:MULTISPECIES: DUF3311 domain-containing protein [Peribacillus]PEJ28316.1 hypothetical protein CN689_22445 [Peribacillus butanolivorans]